MCNRESQACGKVAYSALRVICVCMAVSWSLIVEIDQILSQNNQQNTANTPAANKLRQALERQGAPQSNACATGRQLRAIAAAGGSAAAGYSLKVQRGVLMRYLIVRYCMCACAINGTYISTKTKKKKDSNIPQTKIPNRLRPEKLV